MIDIQSDRLRLIIAKLAKGEVLSEQLAYQTFQLIMDGQANDAQIAAILMAMRVRGEAIEELTGAVRSLRERMIQVEAPDDAVDIVGTGGDGHGTYNISSGAAFVAAGSGIMIAKHGNRAVSSKSGAADVLSHLGINIELSAPKISQCITETGIGFMFAPRHHGAVRHVVKTRAALGIRTIFNIIGPISNPANVKTILLGVHALELLYPIAKTLKKLGCRRAWVVHGADGLDEISTTGETQVVELRDGVIERFILTPEAVNIKPAKIEMLIGGDGQTNAKALLRVLEGEAGALRDIMVFNAAGAIMIAGRADNIAQAVKIAQKSIDSGAAKRCFERLKLISNSS